jgi:hypothetical protein
VRAASEATLSRARTRFCRKTVGDLSERNFVLKFSHWPPKIVLDNLPAAFDSKGPVE